MTNKQKIFTYCMIGTLGFSLHTSIAKADEMPSTRINVVANNLLQTNDNKLIDIKDILSSDILTSDILSADILSENILLKNLTLNSLSLNDQISENESTKESNQLKDISFAQVSSYVNIRDAASEDGKILGKLYNNSAAFIIEKSGDWYKVKSGSVIGYIKADFLLTGEKAEKLADEVGTQIAEVTTTTLKIRDKASVDAPVLDLLPIEEELIVKKDMGEWVKVVYSGNKTGFVSADYVKLRTEFEEAISIEEERERLEEEQATAREEERIANERAQEQSHNSNRQNRSNSNSNNNAIHKVSYNNGSIRNRIVQYAMQFNGNPYVWGGTSLTRGTDCSGFTQSVFRDNGISIPRTSRSQAVSGRRISLSEMQPGDLIFYDRSGTINHVGIFIGGGKVISASSPETGIRITNYNYRTPCKVVSFIS